MQRIAALITIATFALHLVSAVIRTAKRGNVYSRWETFLVFLLGWQGVQSIAGAGIDDDDMTGVDLLFEMYRVLTIVVGVLVFVVATGMRLVG